MDDKLLHTQPYMSNQPALQIQIHPVNASMFRHQNDHVGDMSIHIGPGEIFTYSHNIAQNEPGTNFTSATNTPTNVNLDGVVPNESM